MEHEHGTPDELGKVADLLAKNRIEADSVDKISGVQVGSYEVVTKDKEGEAHVHTLNVARVSLIPKQPTTEITELFRVSPARITPSRRKPVDRGHDDLLVFSDAQIGYRRVQNHGTGEESLIPLHDEGKLEIVRALARAIMPSLIINLGDTIDLAEMSKFAPDSDHFFRTLAPSLQRVHDFYAGLRADNPSARIVEVSSNHNERFNKTILNRVPQLYGTRRASDDSQYAVLTYPYMANLEHVGVEWLGGYPAGEYLHGEEHIPLGRAAIRFAHGTETSQNGTTAAKVMRKHPETHNVQGHDHTDSEAWHTLRNGEMVGSFVLGALCSRLGVVPSYGSSVGDDGMPVNTMENWTSSVMHIRDYRNGRYEFNRVLIHDNDGALYEGRQYSC